MVSLDDLEERVRELEWKTRLLTDRFNTVWKSLGIIGATGLIGVVNLIFDLMRK